MEAETVAIAAPAETVSAAATCPSCHQPVLPSYYFCPNCGFNLRPAPLSTSSGTQLLIYAHSIILPSLLFITISKWKGYTYLKSPDPAEKQIGAIAMFLLVCSTIFTFWYAYTWTMNYVNESIAAINSDLSL